MRIDRLSRHGACAAVVFLGAATSLADPPVSEYPARFTDHERFVVVGVATRGDVTRRVVRRGSSDDDLVFDDASSLRFEQPGAAVPDLSATWRWTSHRRLTFHFTDETTSQIRDELAAGIPFPVRLHCGRGTLRFSRDHQSYSGSQVVRVSGRYRGTRVVVTERIHYAGSRPAVPQPAEPQERFDALLGRLVSDVLPAGWPGESSE